MPVTCKNGHKFVVSWNKYQSCQSGCPICQINKVEKEIHEFVISLGVTAERRTKAIINPLEIDIYAPERKVGIEHCGQWWHSEAILNEDPRYTLLLPEKLKEEFRRMKYQHVEKLRACQEKGVRLLTIFGDEWKYKKDIVESIMANALGANKNRIYARNCNI